MTDVRSTTGQRTMISREARAAWQWHFADQIESYIYMLHADVGKDPQADAAAIVDFLARHLKTAKP